MINHHCGTFRLFGLQYQAVPGDGGACAAKARLSSRIEQHCWNHFTLFPVFLWSVSGISGRSGCVPNQLNYLNASQTAKQRFLLSLRKPSFVLQIVNYRSVVTGRWLLKAIRIYIMFVVCVYENLFVKCIHGSVRIVLQKRRYIHNNCFNYSY